MRPVFLFLSYSFLFLFSPLVHSNPCQLLLLPERDLTTAPPQMILEALRTIPLRSLDQEPRIQEGLHRLYTEFSRLRPQALKYLSEKNGLLENLDPFEVPLYQDSRPLWTPARDTSPSTSREEFNWSRNSIRFATLRLEGLLSPNRNTHIHVARLREGVPALHRLHFIDQDVTSSIIEHAINSVPFAQPNVSLLFHHAQSWGEFAVDVFIIRNAHPAPGVTPEIFTVIATSKKKRLP